MLTESYIEALLVDEDLADQVWEAWDADETDDQVAWLAWWLIASGPKLTFVTRRVRLSSTGLLERLRPIYHRPLCKRGGLSCDKGLPYSECLG